MRKALLLGSMLLSLLLAGCAHRLSREDAAAKISSDEEKSIEAQAMVISNRSVVVTGLVIKTPEAWAEYTETFDYEKRPEMMTPGELKASFDQKEKQHERRIGRAHLQLYDDGWRVVALEPTLATPSPETENSDASPVITSNCEGGVKYAEKISTVITQFISLQEGFNNATSRNEQSTGLRRMNDLLHELDGDSAPTCVARLKEETLDAGRKTIDADSSFYESGLSKETIEKKKISSALWGKLIRELERLKRVLSVP